MPTQCHAENDKPPFDLSAILCLPSGKRFFQYECVWFRQKKPNPMRTATGTPSLMNLVKQKTKHDNPSPEPLAYFVWARRERSRNCEIRSSNCTQERLIHPSGNRDSTGEILAVHHVNSEVFGAGSGETRTENWGLRGEKTGEVANHLVRKLCTRSNQKTVLGASGLCSQKKLTAVVRTSGARLLARIWTCRTVLRA
jgi:hypothetical protein